MEKLNGCAKTSGHMGNGFGVRTRASRIWKMKSVQNCASFFFEYETPKVVTVLNVPLGLLRTGETICWEIQYVLLGILCPE